MKNKTFFNFALHLITKQAKIEPFRIKQLP